MSMQSALSLCDVRVPNCYQRVLLQVTARHSGISIFRLSAQRPVWASAPAGANVQSYDGQSAHSSLCWMFGKFCPSVSPVAAARSAFRWPASSPSQHVYAADKTPTRVHVRLFDDTKSAYGGEVYRMVGRWLPAGVRRSRSGPTISGVQTERQTEALQQPRCPATITTNSAWHRTTLHVRFHTESASRRRRYPCDDNATQQLIETPTLKHKRRRPRSMFFATCCRHEVDKHTVPIAVETTIRAVRGWDRPQCGYLPSLCYCTSAGWADSL